MSSSIQGLPGVKGPVGSAPHFSGDIEDNLYKPSDNQKVRWAQRILARWYNAKLEEAQERGEVANTEHWKQRLQKFIKETKLDIYVSPFTDKIDIGY